MPNLFDDNDNIVDFDNSPIDGNSNTPQVNEANETAKLPSTPKKPAD